MDGVSPSFQTPMNEWTQERSFQYCARLAQSHYENFPIGWFVPRRMRPHLFALYAFARTADDFSDEASGGETQGWRLERLDAWEQHLRKAAHGDPDRSEPVFVALSETIRAFNLPPEWLADLLRAFRMDVTKRHYDTYLGLEEYCRYSANPVGRLVLFLFGYRDPSLLDLSDRICTGIQLVNHWQDVAIDLLKDRIYIPLEDLDRFHYTVSELRSGTVNETFRSLMRFEFERTRRLFHEGRPLLAALSPRLRWQVRLMGAGPLKILDRIESERFDVFRRRPTLSARDKMKLLFSSPWRRAA